VTSRGNAREDIFMLDADRELFLDTLEHAVRRFGLVCHAYCLMGNHYHVVLETPQANLSSAMRFLNSVYAQSFNRRHNRVGHLVQGRFKGILIERDPHLLEVARYIVLNPVRAGLVRHPSAWRWSSYNATAGLARIPPFLTVTWILEQFGSVLEGARERYRLFVGDGFDSDPWRALRGQVVLGSENFAASQVGERATERGAEIPRSQQCPVRPSLAELFNAEGEPAILSAHRLYGYRLAEIAGHIGAHYSTVSRRLRLLEAGEILPPRRHRSRS